MAAHKADIITALAHDTIAPVAGIYKRNYGDIVVYDGGNLSPANALIEIGSDLRIHQPESPHFKVWLWRQMQVDADLLAELYEIVNLAYIGVNVHITGNNAAAIAAAAMYELEQATTRTTLGGSIQHLAKPIRANH